MSDSSLAAVPTIGTIVYLPGDGEAAREIRPRPIVEVRMLMIANRSTALVRAEGCYTLHNWEEVLRPRQAEWSCQYECLFGNTGTA